ncbi:MAG: uroporphyrinogen-III synthase [Alphaproteobacteria bacterium]|nr:uroporphyrinogen-III synthase [Alphaproteobacteria bacterium]
MLPTVLITRPEPANSLTVLAFEAAGFQTIAEPLIQIKYQTCEIILGENIRSYQAVLVTSGMAIRALAAQTTERAFLLMCVGRKSRQLARDLGFLYVVSPPSAVENAATFVRYIEGVLSPKNGPLLYCCGDFVQADISMLLKNQGFIVGTAIVYKGIEKTELSPKALDFLRTNQGGWVTFYSPRTVDVFLKLCLCYNLAGSLSCFSTLSLSPKIEEKLDKTWWKNGIIAPTTELLIVNLKEQFEA